MATMTPMVEYLLALTRPGGGKLVRFGAVQVTVPVFPPGMSITWKLFPYFSAYASIEYWHRFSPSIIPGVFSFTSAHRGIQLQTGLIGATSTADGHSTWVEIMQSEPIVTTIINTSVIGQFFESGDTFLVVDSEADLELVREVVRAWGKYPEGGR